MNLPLVPCETCGTNTPNTGTKRCDSCWEVERRLQHYVRSENGQKFVLEVLWGSQVLANHDRKLRERIAVGLIARAQKFVGYAGELAGFTELAQTRLTFWKEAVEAILGEGHPLAAPACPHDNELKQDEDAPCGCRS